jgi:hypothetical protein
LSVIELLSGLGNEENIVDLHSLRDVSNLKHDAPIEIVDEIIHNL